MKRLPLILSVAPLLVLLFSARAPCVMEERFIYFPERTIEATPASCGLDFEDVRFKAADGTALHGWLLPGQPERPLVLFCHGNAGNISHRLDNLRLFHGLGVGVFIFDYRGYGLSEGRACEQGTYDDARGALAWLQSKGWSNDRLIFFGRSLGAAVALQLAVEQPPAALVLESPFTSIRAMGLHHNPVLTVLLGWLLEARYNNLAKIGTLRSPLLIFHGDSDAIVPPRMGRRLFEKAPRDKRLVVLEGADHNTPLPPHGTPYWQAWRDLLERIAQTQPAR